MFTKIIGRPALAALLLALAVTFLGGTASAATGFVSGKWRMYNNNGNFCPTAADCTGSLYPQSMFATRQPISNARVRIYDDAGTQIGSNVTDVDGNFVVQWTRSTRPTQFRVRVFSQHSEGRFWIAQSNGQLYNVFTSLITTATSSSAGSPQNIGTKSAGSSASPSAHFNAYWAAERQWRETYALVGVLIDNFTDVEVRGFVDDLPDFLGNAPTSIADGATKRVQLDDSAMYKPQARVMHELGHIADYVANPYEFSGRYDFGGSDGWSQGSAEFGSISFEEGFATHGGSVTFWADNAVMPTTCNSTAACYDSVGTPFSNSNLESTSFPFNTDNCVTDEGRRPISAMRFFWDVYDNRNDADGDDYSANQGDFWFHMALLAFYPAGTSNHQINEPWNSGFTSASEPDGRGSSDYSFHYNANLRDIDILRLDNCSPN